MAKKPRATEQPKAAPAPRRKWTYIGPDYNNGIILHQGPTIKPRQMNDEAIDKLLADYPAAARYFSEVVD